MSNFGQSSLGNTKAAARFEHEDSDRGKCSTPGTIRKTAGLKSTPPEGNKKREAEEAEEDVERRERGGKRRQEGPNSRIEMHLGFNTATSMFINVTG